jgi:hypothetical protein
MEVTMSTTPQPEDTPLARSKSMLIRYPEFKTLMREVEQCRILSVGAAEPRCLMIKGAPGVGKSTLARTITSQHPPEETESGTKVPVFYMVTPSPVTVRTMSHSMLVALREPLIHKFTTPTAMNERIITLLKETCAVELVILDEFHHLVDSKTNRVLTSVSDWLKTLIKLVNKPFVVIGIDVMEMILDGNKQLSRLFRRKELRAFAFDLQNGGHDFACFIKATESHLQVPLCPGEPDSDVLTAMYQATDGVIDNIVILFREALLQMQEAGEETMTFAVLAKAYDMGLSGHVGSENPFNGHTYSTKKKKPKDPPDSANNRLATNKPPDPNPISF